MSFRFLVYLTNPYRKATQKVFFICLLAIPCLLITLPRPPTSTLRKSPPRGTLIFHERKFNGLGAQLLRIVDAAAMAELLGWQLCLKQMRYWNYGCAPNRGWGCYFDSLLCETPDGCMEFAMLSDRQLKRAGCATVSTRESAQQVALALEKGGLDAAKLIAKGIWRVNGGTRERMDKLRQTMGLRRGEYIGVHVRRGDKAKEVELLPIEVYAHAVQFMAEEKMPVFVASDDGRTVDELRRLLKGREVVAVPGADERTGHVQAAANQRYFKEQYGMVVELLFEMEMLANASLFVGTFSSNLGRFVHILREGRGNSSVSLDDRWAPGVAWKTFGMSYCEALGANREYCNSKDVV